MFKVLYLFLFLFLAFCRSYEQRDMQYYPKEIQIFLQDWQQSCENLSGVWKQGSSLTYHKFPNQNTEYYVFDGCQAQCQNNQTLTCPTGGSYFIIFVKQDGQWIKAYDDLVLQYKIKEGTDQKRPLDFQIIKKSYPGPKTKTILLKWQMDTQKYQETKEE
jgi:hypothetical protein